MKNKRGSSSKLMLALTIIGFGLAMVSYLANELSPNSDGSQQAVPAARTSAQPILTGLVISGGGAGSSNAPGFISSSDDRASAKKEPSTCIDSDGGTNYNAKGTATASSANEDTARKDWCEARTLFEYYCDGGYAVETRYICPEFCVDGACAAS